MRGLPSPESVPISEAACTAGLMLGSAVLLVLLQVHLCRLLLAVLCRAMLCCAVLLLQVRRLHFHDFMLDVHKRLRSTSGEADPLKHVADDVASGIKVGRRGGAPRDRWQKQGNHHGRQLMLHTVI